MLKNIIFKILTFAVILAGPGAFPANAAEQAQLVKAYGMVQTRGPSEDWQTVSALPAPLAEGERVRTGARAGAVIVFADRSRVELGADSSFALEHVSARRTAMRIELGRLKASVQRQLSARFEVRTPTAVCFVRGTDFVVFVAAGGRTTVDLLRGLLGVEDRRGHQLLLRPNERLRVDVRGMGVPERAPSAAQVLRQDFHAGMRREVGLDQAKEEVLAAAAREVKLAEYQQGKALIDVSGNRVRLEEYILRPSANQFKFVVLNRRESRLDYFYYLGTFNKALPAELSGVLRQLPGGVGAQPEYYLTGFETGRSNTIDSMRELAQGGHPVDVNNNSDLTDNVAWWFDAGSDRYVEVGTRGFFQTLFNSYGFYINGKLKYGWTSARDIASYSEKINASNLDPITGAALTSANAWLDPLTGQLAVRSVNRTFPDPGRVHQRIYESYEDGSFISWDNYILDDQGRVAAVSDFSGLVSGTAFKSRLLDFNYEVVITASEFNGRRIDLVVEPRILISSGLIQ
ncbi:MAG: FecR domain-containing protein [Elusimicrobia bacterium]|nr:FecR domain-containing protein [Elusimicrobiota bacterium]